MLHRVILTAASVIALTAAANAADMYQAPVSYKDAPFVGVNWSGLYVGVNGGYGWDASSLDAGISSPEGGFGGGQIGYNFQRGNIVFGLETDFQGGDISASTAGVGTSKMDWFGTVRGRVGYSFDRALVYATGGFAYGDVNNFGTSETQDGWVVGGGVEYKITPKWSAKAEYQYLSLDATNASGAGRLGDGELDRTEVHTFRVGVNYFVGNVYEPLK